jgi:choice-of-anchor B domain-containing protein
MKSIKFISALAAVILSSAAFGQYASNKAALLSQIPLTSMPGSPSSGAGCTGYTSPAGREYAIMGVRTGTIFVDITVPDKPLIRDLITGSTTLWHENTVMGDYAYLVSDSSGNGMQIVDLHNLDTTQHATLLSTYNGNSLTTVHTIQANPVSKTLYLSGSNRGLVFLDATNPTAPVEVGRWTTKYVHDCVIANYTSGPYAGREIVFACCGGQGLYVLDVTNKAAPIVLGSKQYIASGGYCHSGLLSADKQYFLINDEFDESNNVTGQAGSGATTHVIDVSNLAAPFESTAFHNPVQVIDHNSATQDGLMFLSAYRGGVRIYDHSNPLGISEIGYFDTYPGADAFSYDGAWGTFTGFPSGNILVSDINRGLFVVDPSEAKGWGAPIIAVGVPRGSTYLYSRPLRRLDGSVFRTGPTNLDLTFQTSSPNRQNLQMTLAGYKTGSLTVRLELKDLSTGLYTEVLNPDFIGTTQSFATGTLPGSTYIDAEGKIYARIKVEGIASKSTSVSIDMLKALVN